MHNIFDVEVYFKNCLESIGHPLDTAIAFDTPDWQRYPCPHSRISKTTSGYRAHSDGVPTLKVSCMKCGINQSFSYSKLHDQLTPIQRNNLRNEIELNKKQQQLQATEDLTRALSEIKQLYTQATPCISHPYLDSKQVILPAHHALRLTKDGTLLCPIITIGKQLISIQRIFWNSSTNKFRKMFFKGSSPKNGGLTFGDVATSHVIYFAEGIATALTIHEATGYAVICTYGKHFDDLALILHQTITNKQFVYCCDLPSTNEKVTSQDSAIKAISSVGGSYVLPDFSNIPSELNTEIDRSDFNDLFVLAMANGLTKSAALSEIQRQLSNTYHGADIMTPENETPNQNSFFDEPQSVLGINIPEPYPVDALPKIIRNAVEEVHGFTKAPISMIACSAIASLSLATQMHINVERTNSLVGPVGVFLLTIADSGERKSTCDTYFTKEIRKYEKEQAEIAKPLLIEYRAEMDAWDAKKAAYKEKIRRQIKGNKSTLDTEYALNELETNKPEIPKIPLLLFTDATPEGLTLRLNQWPSAGLICPEAGAVLGAHGMSNDSIMRNLSMQNTAWDGGVLEYLRKTSGSLTIHDARLTQYLQVQEATLQEFMDRSGKLARGIGYFARFLIAWPESTQGTRFFTDAPTDWVALNAYNRNLANILNKPIPNTNNGSLERRVLRLSENAKAAWILFHDAIETELSAQGNFYDIRDVASKAADNAARISALFQFLENENDSVSLENFESASRIVLWHLCEAKRFFGEFSQPIELVNAARLIDWLVKFCVLNSQNSIQRRDVQRKITPHKLRKRENLNPALDELVNAGYIKLIDQGRSKEIHVNPALLTSGT